MTDTTTIALVQHVSTPGDVGASLKRIKHYAEQASKAGVELLLFPEASLTGYNNTLELNQEIAEAKDGQSAHEIASICKEHRLAIAYGFAERDDNLLYNSVQLIDENGSSLALYRKTHLWGDQDRTLFTAGDDLVPVVQWNGWRLGFLICYDIEFPETVRRLAIEGAELILNPTALMTPWTTVADQVVPVRAYENQVFIAYANFCGNEHEQEYVGHSCIAGPGGETLAKANDTEQMLIAKLDKSSITSTRAALPYHRDRLPKLYKALIDNDR